MSELKYESMGFPELGDIRRVFLGEKMEGYFEHRGHAKSLRCRGPGEFPGGLGLNVGCELSGKERTLEGSIGTSS